MSSIEPVELPDVAEGCPAHRAYRSVILAHPGLTAFALCRYRSPPPLQARRTLEPREQEIVALALERRKDGVSPFWQAVFSACLQKGWSSEGLVDAALFHNGPGEIEAHPVTRLLEGEVSDLFGDGERNVGLSSRLERADGTTAHLALLDFRCEVSPENTHLLSIVCARLYGGGFVLIDSGDSYHACGLELVSSGDRVVFLARALRLAPIVDTAYVAHQLQQPFSSIRLSRGGSRNQLPRVVAFQPC